MALLAEGSCFLSEVLRVPVNADRAKRAAFGREFAQTLGLGLVSFELSGGAGDFAHAAALVELVVVLCGCAHTLKTFNLISAD